MAFPAGFYIAGVEGENNNNLALIYAPDGMTAAGVFTVNTCSAHPVNYSKKVLLHEKHKLILVNKGIANAATGPEGYRRLENFLCEVSQGMDIGVCEILAASTGVIGRQMEIEPALIRSLLDSAGKIDPDSFARAIMTTDTRPKQSSRTFNISGLTVNIAGIAKGSGMIAPDMATMLAFIVSDVSIDKDALQRALKISADQSFNRLNIDGEMSTNDTVFLAASGKAGNKELNVSDYSIFCKELKMLCIDLVAQLAADGEGATKYIKVNIKQAESLEAAQRACRAIAVSPLCKTAFYGNSPNWGRIISALGSSGIKLKFEKFCIDINSVNWIKDGVPVPEQKKVITELEKERLELDIFLGAGDSEASSYTCDYSPEYININAGYLS